MIWSNIGRYGPYLKHAETISFKGGTNANLDSIEEVWEIGMNRAVEVLASKPKRGKPAPATPLASLGEHPEAGGEVNVMKGRYGPYVKWGKVNATLPGMKPDQITVTAVGSYWMRRPQRAEKSGPQPRKRQPRKRKVAFEPIPRRPQLAWPLPVFQQQHFATEPPRPDGRSRSMAGVSPSNRILAVTFVGQTAKFPDCSLSEGVPPVQYTQPH